MKDVFICYSRKDSRWRELVETHLDGIRRTTNLHFWSDQKTEIGVDWQRQIRESINNSAAAILLVSADFYASSFIMNEELPLIFQNAAIGRIKIFVFYVRSVSKITNEKVGQIQALNDPATPLAKLNRPNAEETISHGLTKLSEYLKSIENLTLSEMLFNHTFRVRDPELIDETRNNEIEGKNFRFLDLIKENNYATHFSNYSFKNCIIRGPSVLIINNNVQLCNCTFNVIDGDMDTVLYHHIRPGAKAGAIAISETKFDQCVFDGIGFTSGDYFLEQMRSSTSNRNDISLKS